MIIKEAKNPDNLAVLYEGWTPWVWKGEGRYVNLPVGQRKSRSTATYGKLGGVSIRGQRSRIHLGTHLTPTHQCRYYSTGVLGREGGQTNRQTNNIDITAVLSDLEPQSQRPPKEFHHPQIPPKIVSAWPWQNISMSRLPYNEWTRIEW